MVVLHRFYCTHVVVWEGVSVIKYLFLFIRHHFGRLRSFCENALANGTQLKIGRELLFNEATTYGVTVPITSSVSVYTKVLAQNLNGNIK